MKAVMIFNPLYIPKLNISDATLAELADGVLTGDELYDPITGRAYQVASRGFLPRRSDATVDRLVWSREAVAGFRGKCAELRGRILVDTPLLEWGWSLASCSVQSTSAPLPIGIPIVGTIAIDRTVGCGVFVINDLRSALVIQGIPSSKMETCNVITLRCRAPGGVDVEVKFRLNEQQQLPLAGRILNWDEDDTESKFLLP